MTFDIAISIIDLDRFTHPIIVLSFLVCVGALELTATTSDTALSPTFGKTNSSLCACKCVCLKVDISILIVTLHIMIEVHQSCIMHHSALIKIPPV